MEKLWQSRENEGGRCFDRKGASIFSLETNIKGERERERKSMKQIPRGAVSTVPFYVITRNQCPLFPFIPFPRFRWKTRKRKNVFEGRQWRERELSGGANYRALSTLIDRYPSGGEVWINGRERIVGASAGKGLGGRQKRKRIRRWSNERTEWDR